MCDEDIISDNAPVDALKAKMENVAFAQFGFDAYDSGRFLGHIRAWMESLTNFVQRGGGYNAYPYAQPYRDPDAHNEPPQWQKDMAGWTNKRMCFFASSFADFSPRKGFRCEEYLKRYLE